MLQQTQVDRVRPRYEAWLARWPDAASLAAAPAAAVIREWSGLGYNRRAVNLQRAAREALERFGRIPIDEERLRSLPGIGPYTAAAVACFAGGRRTAALDTNVARVAARALLGEARARAPYGPPLREAAEAWLPARGARAHQLAVMDLGATICKASSPACEACPLARGCAWLAAGRPDSRPAIPKAEAVPFEATARFARGRIVAMLAESGPLPTTTIAARPPQRTPRPLPALPGGAGPRRRHRAPPRPLAPPRRSLTTNHRPLITRSAWHRRSCRSGSARGTASA